MIGIYKITNLINNYCYIGQSVDIKTRWNHHKNYSKKYSHYPLYEAFRKYGIENFSFEIIEECPINELNEKEIYWIKFYDSYNNGYNQTKGGSQGGHIVKISNEDLEIIYDLLQNSDLPQTKIAEMFNVRNDTISEINWGKTRSQENYSYPLRNNRRLKKYCQDCGVEITSRAIRCPKCNSLQNRVIKNRPNREELKTLIRSKSFLEIGRIYNVSDNTIRKWCITENLPSKKSIIKQYSDEDWNNL